MGKFSDNRKTHLKIDLFFAWKNHLEILETIGTFAKTHHEWRLLEGKITKLNGE